MPQSTPNRMSFKPCGSCAQVKLLDQFPVRGRGRGAVCQQCLGDTPLPTHMTCTGGCGKTKPVDEFCRMGDGYKKPCKDCHRKKCRKPDSPPRKRYPDPPLGHKWCTRCDECKLREEFPLARTKSGFGSWCKRCVAAHNREQYRKPDVREDRLARRKAWGFDNPTWSSDWRGKNPERARQSGRGAAARRRARRRGLPCEPYTVTQIIERDGTRCLLGDHELNFAAQEQDPEMVTIEHLECLSWDNSAGDVLSNAALACLSHNCQRGDRPHPAAARKRAELLAVEQELPA